MFVTGFQGQSKEVPGDCAPPDRAEELGPQQGQAILGHRQV